MMILKNIQRTKTIAVETIIRNKKTVEFEFEQKGTQSKTKFFVVIYFDYIKSRNIKALTIIKVNDNGSVTYKNQDYITFWDDVKDAIKREIENSFFLLIGEKDRPEIVNKIYDVIKILTEVEERVSLISV